MLPRPAGGGVGVEHREGAGVAVAGRGDEAAATQMVSGRQARLAGTDDDDVHRRGGDVDAHVLFNAPHPAMFPTWMSGAHRSLFW